MKTLSFFCASTQGKKYPIIILSLLIVLLFVENKPLQASGIVSGRHLSTSGKKIVLGLSIQSPAPSNLIIEQYIAPVNSVVSTSPPAKKINRKSGKIKWLFRNISPGKLTIMTMLQKPLRGTVSTVVRYRDPSSGQYVEQNIHP